MVWPNYTPTGSQLIIGKLMICLHVMEFFLIMKVQGEERLSLREK